MQCELVMYGQYGSSVVAAACGTCKHTQTCVYACIYMIICTHTRLVCIYMYLHHLQSQAGSLALGEFDLHHLSIQPCLECPRQLLQTHLEVDLVPLVLPLNAILIKYVTLCSTEGGGGGGGYTQHRGEGGFTQHRGEGGEAGTT